tara:strand:+ start:8432 stop:8644 length:213 start_codon:yes stop_codon:yes gene_type:complete
MSDFKLTASDFDDCSTIIVLSERAKKFWNDRNYKDRIVVGNSSQNIFVINNYERVRICNEIRENNMDFTD